jgi:hypothetical protein
MTITFANDVGTVFYTLELDNVHVLEVTQSDSTSATQLKETVTFQAQRYLYSFFIAGTSTLSTFGWDCLLNQRI